MVYQHCSMPLQTWSTTTVACHHRYGLSQIPGCHLPGGLLLRLRLFPLGDLVPTTMPFIGPAVSSAMRFFRAGVGVTFSSFLVLLNSRLGWRARYLRVNLHCSLASAQKASGLFKNYKTTLAHATDLATSHGCVHGANSEAFITHTSSQTVYAHCRHAG